MTIGIEDSRGLCMTCNNAPTCFYRASRGPALYCETFDDYVEPAMRTANRLASPSADRPKALPPTEEDASPIAGLCINCDHRRSCRHPRPLGGVWHCEDYK